MGSACKWRCVDEGAAMFVSKRQWKVITVLGSVLVTAASISPHDAITNLGHWAQIIGLNDFALWLNKNSADRWGIVIGSAAVICGFSMLIYPMFIRFMGESLTRTLIVPGVIILTAGISSLTFFGSDETRTEITNLRAASAVDLSIGAPTWEKQGNGNWAAIGSAHVNSKYQRSGVVIGITAAHFKSFKLGTIGKTTEIHSEYKGNKDLGDYEHYIKRPIGLYFLYIEMSEKSDIAIRYRFEGEKEGERVTWKAP